MAGRRVDPIIDDDVDFEDFIGSDSEINGPPPLPTEFINAIPITQVTQDQVNDKLQCTVCKQDFTINEHVKQLKCQHLYHENCIRPWLELHSTCPICRENQSPAGDCNNESERHRNRITDFFDLIHELSERRRGRNQALISFSAPSLVMETEPISTTELDSSSASNTSGSSSDSQHTVDMHTIDTGSSNEEFDYPHYDVMASTHILNLHPSSTTTDSTSSDTD